MEQQQERLQKMIGFFIERSSNFLKKIISNFILRLHPVSLKWKCNYETETCDESGCITALKYQPTKSKSFNLG